jgi:hypothetical protein
VRRGARAPTRATCADVDENRLHLAAMPSLKYALPVFLAGVCTEPAYIRWLRYRAQAHVKRDRKRGNLTATRESYMQAIHVAVVASDGRDVYTGERLEWNLISTWDNVASQEGRRIYKKQFAMLPTVDQWRWHRASGFRDLRLAHKRQRPVA